MVDARINSPTDTVPYHQQDTNYWCGSACTLMVLHSLGISRAGGFGLDQKRVRAIAHNSAKSDPTYQWVSAPDGLTAALNYFTQRSDQPLPPKHPDAAGSIPASTPTPTTTMKQAVKQAGRTTYSAAPLPPPRWELVALDSEEEISRHIVWTLWRYKAPVVALVFGMMHWVVVGGCVTTRPPRSADDTGYSILGFHICDPWPPIPRELARNDHFRHLDQRDPSGLSIMADGCGSGFEGDINSDTLGGRGVALRYVSYNDWCTRDHSTPERRKRTGYMTGVPPTLKLTNKPGKPEIAVRSRWIGKFIAICDPYPIAPDIEETLAPTRSLDDILTRIAPHPGTPGTASPVPAMPLSTEVETAHPSLLRTITPDEAVAIARDELDNYHRYYAQTKADKDHRQLTGTAGEPVLVEWLDESGTYLPEAAYYIVPFSSGEIQHSVVRVAARMPFWLWDKEEEDQEKRKLFLGINILKQTQSHPHPEQSQPNAVAAIIDEDRARRAILGRSFWGMQGGAIRVPCDYSGSGTLVWKPCLESFDPCCPFYQFAIPCAANITQPNYLFVRAFDSKVFSHLTEHVGGA